MITRVIFRYSWVYDDHWRSLPKTFWHWQKAYPQAKRTERYLARLENAWGKDGRRLLTEMSRVTSLPWKLDRQMCYIVGRAFPFSDPLTIPVYSTVNRGLDVLTHEMIHRLLGQPGNFEKILKPWRRYERLYKAEHPNTVHHIYLEAIHQHLLLKFFNAKRFAQEQKSNTHLPQYRRAWEIIQELGYRRILAAFLQGRG